MWKSYKEVVWGPACSITPQYLSSQRVSLHFPSVQSISSSVLSTRELQHAHLWVLFTAITKYFTGSALYYCCSSLWSSLWIIILKKKCVWRHQHRNVVYLVVCNSISASGLSYVLCVYVRRRMHVCVCLRDLARSLVHLLFLAAGRLWATVGGLRPWTEGPSCWD